MANSPRGTTGRYSQPGASIAAAQINLPRRHGWECVLAVRRGPGSPANLDHLAIGPGGIFVIDSKQYRGRLQLDPSGRLWHGRHPLSPPPWAPWGSRPTGPPRSCPTRAWWWCRPWPSTAPRPPGARSSSTGCRSCPQRLPSMLRALPAVLEPERVAALAAQARVRFHAAA